MEIIKKILVTLALVLLCFAGCESDLTGVSGSQDIKGLAPVDNFLVTQSYGYCNDTMCVGTSIILDIIEGQNEQCIFLYINTGDTVYNGLSFDKFSIDYNLSHSYTVDFGNGNKQIFNNEGTYIIDWKCNKTYEVIICYEQTE